MAIQPVELGDCRHVPWSLDSGETRMVAPHRHSYGSKYKSLRQKGQPNKYKPHMGKKQLEKAARRAEANGKR